MAKEKEIDGHPVTVQQGSKEWIIGRMKLLCWERHGIEGLNGLSYLRWISSVVLLFWSRKGMDFRKSFCILIGLVKCWIWCRILWWVVSGESFIAAKCRFINQRQCQRVNGVRANICKYCRMFINWGLTVTGIFSVRHVHFQLKYSCADKIHQYCISAIWPISLSELVCSPTRTAPEGQNWRGVEIPIIIVSWDRYMDRKGCKWYGLGSSKWD